MTATLNTEGKAETDSDVTKVTDRRDSSPDSHPRLILGCPHLPRPDR